MISDLDLTLLNRRPDDNCHYYFALCNFLLKKLREIGRQANHSFPILIVCWSPGRRLISRKILASQNQFSWEIFVSYNSRNATFCSFVVVVVVVGHFAGLSAEVTFFTTTWFHFHEIFQQARWIYISISKCLECLKFLGSTHWCFDCFWKRSQIGRNSQQMPDATFIGHVTYLFLTKTHTLVICSEIQIQWPFVTQI